MKLKDILANNKLISDNTDKHTTHDYVDGFYEHYFSQYRDKEVNVLEIGIDQGGSIALWSEYFQKGKIFGADITPVRFNPNFLNLKNTTLYYENAYSDQFVSKIENMDIIIDDGPHTIESMIYVVRFFASKIKSNGMIVIEDIQEMSWIDTLKNQVPKNFGCNYFDLRQNKNRYDDLMFVMKRFD